MEDRFREFTFLISKIMRNIHRIKAEEMTELGLKSAYVSCLYYLFGQEEGLTAKELCDLCGEDKSAISRSLDYLETNGYVYCESQSVKRYRAPVRLTEKGRETGSYISEKVKAVTDAAGRDLSEDERETLYAGLNRINKNLEKICEQYGG